MNALIEENPVFDLESLAAASFFSQTSAGEKYLIFSLQKTLYAIAARQVTEVIQSASVTPLPKTPGWIAGITHLRGEMISVIDLQELWNAGIKTIAARTKLIRLRSPDNSVAFIADKVQEIVALARGEIEPIENSPFLLGKIAYQGDVLHLIDADRLLRKRTLSAKKI